MCFSQSVRIQTITSCMWQCHSWNSSVSDILYNVNDSKSTADGNNSNSEHVNGVSFQAFAVLQWRSLFFLGVPLDYRAIGVWCFKTVWWCHLQRSGSPQFFFLKLTLENQGNVFLWNIRNHSLNNTASHSKRPEFSWVKVPCCVSGSLSPRHGASSGCG